MTANIAARDNIIFRTACKFYPVLARELLQVDAVKVKIQGF
jgi:hypothetical protein